MTLTTHTQMRRCGRRWASEAEAGHSKLYLAGGQEVIPCIYGCGGFHLSEIKSAATGRAATPKDTGPDRATRAAVYTRDGFACVCCGTPIKDAPHSVGHRKRRSQGGTNEPTNLLTFLGLGSDAGNPDDHHARIDSRLHSEDRERGYTCQSFEDPALIGVTYFERDGAGFTAWLCPDGSLSFDGPGVAA